MSTDRALHQCPVCAGWHDWPGICLHCANTRQGKLDLVVRDILDDTGLTGGSDAEPVEPSAGKTNLREDQR